MKINFDLFKKMIFKDIVSDDVSSENSIEDAPEDPLRLRLSPSGTDH